MLLIFTACCLSKWYSRNAESEHVDELDPILNYSLKYVLFSNFSSYFPCTSTMLSSMCYFHVFLVFSQLTLYYPLFIVLVSEINCISAPKWSYILVSELSMEKVGYRVICCACVVALVNIIWVIGCHCRLFVYWFGFGHKVLLCAAKDNTCFLFPKECIIYVPAFLCSEISITLFITVLSSSVAY